MGTLKKTTFSEKTKPSSYFSVINMHEPDFFIFLIHKIKESQFLRVKKVQVKSYVL